MVSWGSAAPRCGIRGSLGHGSCTASLRGRSGHSPTFRPPGGWTLWRLDYDAWSGIQFGLLGVLAAGILVHVMLHWSWVCNVIASALAGKGRVDEGMQTIYGVGLLIVLLNVVGITVAAAVLTIRAP